MGRSGKPARKSAVSRKGRRSRESIAELRPSSARRWLGVIALAALGTILTIHGLSSPDRGPVVAGLSVVLGIGFLWQSWRHLESTRSHIVLTRIGLFDGTGDRVCSVDNIVSIDRSLFAFKPTNGFLIRLRSSETPRWVPGLYWRVGRRVGIGGATRSHEAKVMAERLDGLIRDRTDGRRTE
ncbi:MAG: hypothetical protein OXL68_07245 [Paracoccaceae bacterium]|nr:hypothetical protein [Paracoccaceae bacterium]